uniref:Uncharacterized protein n=1 Tax=Anguilla anguilla TaxID=7936 RepID=A0A0E9WG02_ANGAN
MSMQKAHHIDSTEAKFAQVNRLPNTVQVYRHLSTLVLGYFLQI